MTTPTIQDVYGFFWDAVKYYAPGDHPIDQLQTFAVLSSVDQVNAENLEKNALATNSNLFFSRKWEQDRSHPSKMSFLYPALFLIEEGIYMKGAFTDKKRDCTSFALAVVYPDTAKQEGRREDAKQLMTPQIVNACRLHLSRVIHYLDDIVYAQLGDGSMVWENKTRLDYLLNGGFISSYKVLPSTALYKKMMRIENPENEGGLYDDWQKDQLAGAVVRINYCQSNCLSTVYRFDQNTCCDDYDRP